LCKSLALFLTGKANEKEHAYMRMGLLSLLCVVALMFSACNDSQLTTTTSSSANFGQQTKTSGCVASGGLPDAACTPGAIFPNATVDQICTSGYAKSVRNVPSSEKDQVYAEYGITTRYSGEYEVDHLVSLELGGSNDIANLWPEAASPQPGFHEKDSVENYLHDQLCTGKIALADAQQEIATNWLAVYQQIHP
jgi:hypothetical protein